MSEIQSPRHFYLGAHYDVVKKEVDRDYLFHYDSKDLCTHGVVLGMTGSGKTGLAISLIEEALQDDIPAILIDPKGDLSNLALCFSDYDEKDFEKWSPGQGSKMASLWKKGHEDWKIDAERLKKYKENHIFEVLSPGADHGIPVSILGSLNPPTQGQSNDVGETVSSTAHSLLCLLGRKKSEDEASVSFLSNIIMHYWVKNQGLSLESLILNIQNPPFEKIGVMALDDFYSKRKRTQLAMAFNSLLSSPKFANWLKGVPLNIGNCFRDEKTGKAKITVFSIAHLNDDERMFFVSLLLAQLKDWMRLQPGATRLKNLLYMDEIFGYLPPSENPPSKKNMLILLKQARAFGLGVLLATQNPVDLDYRALSNIGTWFIGRLQTEQDKEKVMEGLKSLNVEVGGLDAKTLDQLLSTMESRAFICRNVHEKKPSLFHVRWVNSYLCGPMTEPQLEEIIKDRKKEVLSLLKVDEQKLDADENEKTTQVSQQISLEHLDEHYLEAAAEYLEDKKDLVYMPAVYAQVRLESKVNKKVQRSQLRLMTRINKKDDFGKWKKSIELNEAKVINEIGIEDIQKASLPESCLDKKYLKELEDHIKNYLLDDFEYSYWTYNDEELLSLAGETKNDFYERIKDSFLENRDENLDEIKKKYQKDIDSLDKKIVKAQGRIEREKAQSKGAKVDMMISIGSTLLGAFMGKKTFSATNVRRGASAGRRATKAWKEGQDVERMQDEFEELEIQMEELVSERDQEIKDLETGNVVSMGEVKEATRQLSKNEFKVIGTSVLWLPFYKASEFELEKAW